MRILFGAIEPGMLQVMIMAAAGLMIPLEKREHAPLRIVLGLLAGFVTGGLLSTIDLDRVIIPSYWFFMIEDLAILMLVVLFLLLCTKLSIADSIYVMTGAFIVQHSTVGLLLILEELGISVQTQYGNIFYGWLVSALFGSALIILINTYIPINGHYLVSWNRVAIMTCIVLLLAMVFPLVIGAAWDLTSNTALLICQVYDLLSCLLFIWLQVGLRQEVKLLASLTAERRLRQQMKEQYEMTRENIDLINHKCHDLRHQIAGLRFVKDNQQRDDTLREIEKSVMIYDLSVKTGNEVLDTVLTEKGLICADNQITWTCMADGSKMDFISPVDIYTIFGNALDNAIESSRKLPEKDRRIIRVVVRQEYGGAFIQISNYYDSISSLPDGRLETTKADKENHGFGLSSIQRIVKSYGGTMNIETNGGIFLLSLLIPYSKGKRP